MTIAVLATKVAIQVVRPKISTTKCYRDNLSRMILLDLHRILILYVKGGSWEYLRFKFKMKRQLIRVNREQKIPRLKLDRSCLKRRLTALQPSFPIDRLIDRFTDWELGIGVGKLNFHSKKGCSGSPMPNKL